MEIFSLLSNSFYACFLLSIAIGIVGSLIVIQKSTFIAGSIAHGSFGGIGIALYFSLPILLSISIFAAILAFILSFITLRYPHRQDTFIGALWAFGMSVGIIFVDMTPGYQGGVISYLFGSILTISDEDIYMMIGVDVLLVVFMSFFRNQVLLISYDKEFAKLKGINVFWLFLIVNILIALSIVMSVRAVGIILIIAMFTIPPFIAEKFTNSFVSMMILSAILSFLFLVSGIFVSFYYDISATAVTVIIAVIAFSLSLFKRN